MTVFESFTEPDVGSILSLAEDSATRSVKRGRVSPSHVPGLVLGTRHRVCREPKSLPSSEECLKERKCDRDLGGVQCLI